MISHYARLPLGTKVDGGEIQACPKCGNLGLAKEETGKLWFTHSQASYVDEKGILRFGVRHCEPLSLPKTPPNQVNLSDRNELCRFPKNRE
jgi:hypothetical protein